MAAKRRASSNGGGGGEKSNTGLVVSLVFFVLTSIFLGVLTYYGYAGRSEAVASEAKKNADLQSMTKNRDEERTRKLVLRIATGNDQKDDQTSLAGLKGSNGGAFTEETASLKNLPKWDPALNRPTKTYEGMLADALTAKLAAEKALKDTEGNFQAQVQAFEEYKKEKDAKLAKAEDALKKANAATVETQNKKSEEYLAAIAKIDEQSKLITELTTQIADLNVKRGQDQTKAAETESNLKKVLQEAQTKLEPPSSIENDYSKGKIFKIDHASGLAYINLGSADYAKQGLTFSIFSPTAGNRPEKRERKGSLEIVTVLEPHLSTARFTQVQDANRNPILPGDLLFNPAWSPAQREHIAIAGIIDIDGDGTDDTPELVRALERQGIVVDAWLDVKERKIKGTGINERTTYFVLGESYKWSSSIPIDTDSPIFQASNELNGKIEEMKTKAHDTGVTTVAYRRFLSLIGYKLPKVAQPDYSSTTYLRGPSGSIKAPAPKNEDKEKEAPKEEKPK